MIDPETGAGGYIIAGGGNGGVLFALGVAFGALISLFLSFLDLGALNPLNVGTKVPAAFSQCFGVVYTLQFSYRNRTKKIVHTIFFTVILFALNLLSGMLFGEKSILIFSGIWTSIGLCIAVANLVLLIILSGLQKRVIKDIER